MFNLEELGFAEPFKTAFYRLHDPNLKPARVCAAYRGRYLVSGEFGQAQASLSGRLRYAVDAADLPTVGDWVAVTVAAGGQARIEALLPRRSVLLRAKAAGSSVAQPIVANVDTVFIAMALDQDFNLRRLERYLALVYEGGAQAVVLLTKADLQPRAAELILEAQSIAAGAPVHAVSVMDQRGLGVLARYLRPGQTVALVGSSGVGKSTLVNHLLGKQAMTTAEIRASDGRGKHTTSHRELFQLPNGALLVDTPGMRELGLWDAESGLARTFADAAQLATRCRFGDCGHGSEPGCALTEAVAAGTLPESRYHSYLKLQAELAHLERKTDERKRREHAVEQKREWKTRKRDIRQQDKRR